MSKTLTVRISDAQINRFMGHDTVGTLRDVRHGNLYFRFGTNCTGSWYLVFHRDAKTEWKKIGNYPAVKTASVLSKFPDILAQYTLVPHSAVLLAEWECVADLLEWYEQRVLVNRAMTAKRKASIKSVLKVHLRPKLGDVLIDDLEHSVLDARLIWPLQADYELSTVRLILSVLKKAFKQARTLKLIPFNPIAEVRFSDFTDAEIVPKSCSLHVNALPGMATQLVDFEPMERAFVLMMLLHGTRIGETRLAKWSHIDVKNKTWFIPKKNTKTKVDLLLPLTDVALNLLVDLGVKGYGYLFSTALFGHFSEMKANEIVQRVSLREWRAHDFRKFARTSWMDLGVDYLVGELLLNHALNKMDKTYIHSHANHLMRKALVTYHDWLLTQGFAGLLKSQPGGGENACN